MGTRGLHIRGVCHVVATQSRSEAETCFWPDTHPARVLYMCVLGVRVRACGVCVENQPLVPSGG